ncbi:hypothetical protein XO28_0021 [Bacillus phage phi4J1]|uniref:Uncharacterized protein n=1 Tax=Bacillus phage phi4J1 TaxID=1643326 RepID=A0A0S2MVB1_9CAUD|nr:hypothetical protein XO28_0021 [Bacillus phage phi4J1]ALO79862.1 hypothetical protein XO28_0021 [Bacillus phage phi4J1]
MLFFDSALFVLIFLLHCCLGNVVLSKKSSPTYIFKNPLLYLEGDFFIFI